MRSIGARGLNIVTIRGHAGESDDFTILVPLYGDPAYVAVGRPALSRYRPARSSPWRSARRRSWAPTCRRRSRAAATGGDLASVKVEAANRTTVIARLQNLEYRIATLTRHCRPWLTSGACIIARTESLRLSYGHHSPRTPGEDIETGRAAARGSATPT